MVRRKIKPDKGIKPDGGVCLCVCVCVCVCVMKVIGVKSKEISVSRPCSQGFIHDGFYS